jgi:pimeloyl-ACP methyl ester carboxylesterase
MPVPAILIHGFLLMPVPAILIHGFLDAGAIWAPVVADLGPEAEAWLTPDLAGMGALSADAGRHKLPRYCADITRLIDQTEGSLVLVGHSMGTQVAELAALARPDRIRALVLLSPVPLGGPHAPAEVTGPLAATGGDVAAQREARRGLMASPVDPEILDWLTDLGRAVRRTVIEELVATWNTGVPEALADGGRHTRHRRGHRPGARGLRTRARATEAGDDPRRPFRPLLQALRHRRPGGARLVPATSYGVIARCGLDPDPRGKPCWGLFRHCRCAVKALSFS